MYRNEEASNSLNNKLEMKYEQSVGTGDSVLVFSILSCVTEVRHLMCMGGR